jgi:hypothetical protein
MKSLLALAACAAALSAAPALAQDGGADPHAADAYAGASKQQFYDVDGRIAALEQRIGAMGRGGARIRAALNQVKAFEAQQRARHNGELRDWDREAINTRLDRVEALLGGRAG